MKPTLALVMLVRDSMSFLPHILPEISPYMDEIILVDTGSIDETFAYCQKFTSDVHKFKWNNDFSAARNYALTHVKSDWILFLDSDETIQPDGIEKIRHWIATTNENSAQTPVYQTAFGKYTTDAAIHIRTKLFKNHLNIHFRNPFIEILCDETGRQLTGPYLHDIPMFHWGSNMGLSPEKYAEKKVRNINILTDILQSNSDPQNQVFYQIQLAINYMESKSPEMALSVFESIIQDNQAPPHLITYCQLKAAKSAFDSGEYKKAQLYAFKVLRQDKNHAEMWNNLAKVAFTRHHLGRAKMLLDRSMKCSTPVLLTMEYDPFQSTIVPHCILAVIAVEGGQLERANDYLDACKQWDPAHPDVERVRNYVKNVEMRSNSNG